MALSNSTVVKTFGSKNYHLIFEWERVSVNVRDNSSTIRFAVKLKDVNGFGAYFTTDTTLYTYVNGESFTSHITNGTEIAPYESYKLVETTTTIPHNTSGSQQFYWNFDYSWTLHLEATSGTSFNQSASGSEIIDAVDGFTKLLNVTPADPTDEDTFTIEYFNPAGDYAVSVQACISFIYGLTMAEEWRDLPKTETTFSFTLTDDEKDYLYSKVNEGITTIPAYFFVRSTIPSPDGNYNETQVTNPLIRNIFVKGTLPTLEPVIEADPETQRFTGSPDAYISGYSDAYFTIGAEAHKGAEIVRQYITNGSQQINDTPTGVLNNVTSNTFYIYAEDSRGNIERKAVVVSIVDYFHPTCKAKIGNISANGEVEVELSGKYFNGSFGLVTNSLTADYKAYVDGEDIPDAWTSQSLSLSIDSENNYTSTLTISGLEYDKRYRVIVRVFDELATSAETSAIVASSPLFDWGKEDFRFYIPVQMDKGFMYPQTLLWRGAAQMDETETITLDKPISEMPTGIVLVFSLYRDGAATDASIQSFFLSRVELQYLFSGKPHMFMMGINSNLSVFGSKYLYINEDSISGFEGNTNSGNAASGITFDNSQFVLRYVIGV